MSELAPDGSIVPEEDIEIPAALPVLPLKDSVVFPQSMTPLAVAQERSVRLVNDVLSGNRLLGLVTLRDPEIEEPALSDLYEIGTAAVVHRTLRMPDGSLRVLVQGVSRVRVGRQVQDEPYLVAEVTEVPDVVEESTELEALVRTVQTSFGRLIELVPYLPQELQIAVANIDDPAVLSYLVASSVRMQTEDKQQLLEEVDVAARLRELVRLLGRELEVVELGSKIQSQVASEVEKTAAGIPPAPAAAGDPGGAGRGRSGAGRARGAAHENRRSEPARARAHGCEPRALEAGEAAAGRSRIRRHPHLPRVAPHRAVEHGHA